MLVFRYSSGSAWSVDLGQAAVRLGSLGLTTNAELGSVGISTVTIDNPTQTVGRAADNIVAWKTFAVDELASAGGNQRIYQGLIGDRTYRRGRGPTSSLRTGPAGVIDMTVSDLNALLTLRIVTGLDGVRPAETVSARLTWLLASAYLTGLVYDNGFVAANTTALDPVDFRGQRPHDVLGDLATITHFNFFVYWNEANAQASLWFDEANFATTYDSAAFISNVLADIDQAAIVAGTATTFYPLDDALLLRSSAAIYSGAYITHAKGAVYVTAGATATAFIARDGSAPNANLKTAAAATTTANTFLTDGATEDDRITCTIQVAAAQANVIKAGQLVQVKFSDLPGYAAYTSMRVAKRSVIGDEPQRDRYKLRLEMSPAAALFVGDAFAAYLRSGTDVNEALAYGYTGDAPPGGWYAQPLVGPMAYVQSVSPFYGLRANARMYLRIEARANFAVVISAPPATLRIDVMRNGVSIGSASLTNTVGGYWSDTLAVDLRNVLVNTNDVITIASAALYIWGSTGTNNEYLRVGRGSYNWIGQPTWTGP